MGGLKIIARRKARACGGISNIYSLQMTLPKVWCHVRNIKLGDILDCYVDEKFRLVINKEPVSGKDCGKQV